MMYDGLHRRSFDHIAMGLSTEQYNEKTGQSSRESARAAFAAASHEKAAAAAKDGRLADEIVPVQVPQRKGDPLLVEVDEGVQPEDHGRVAGCPEAGCDQDGTITAGNLSQISDGGAAVPRRDVGRQGQGASA